MTGFEVIATVALVPMCGHPMRAVALVHPAALDPHVLAAVPLPVAGCPYIAPPRWRYFDHARLRWPHFNVDISACDGRRGHCRTQPRQRDERKNRCAYIHKRYLLRS